MDLASAGIWILEFIGSHYLGKAYEYVTEPHEEEREPFVERYIKLREEVKWFESLTEDTLQNTYKAIRLYAEETIPEALEYIETNYNENSLELGKMYIEHPWIKQATEDMTIDSTDSTIQVIMMALGPPSSHNIKKKYSPYLYRLQVSTSSIVTISM